MNEAQANHQTALEQFIPSLSPGIAYHQRDGMAQAVPAGTVSDTHFQSYAPGGTVEAQVVLGDSIYQALAAKQLVQASDQSLQAQREDAALSAAQAYFDLVKAKALADVIREAVSIAQDYQQELHQAVAPASPSKATNSACKPRRKAGKSPCGRRSNSSASRRSTWPRFYSAPRWPSPWSNSQRVKYFGRRRRPPSGYSRFPPGTSRSRDSWSFHTNCANRQG